LLDFSRAVTGNLFFVPSASFVDDVSDEQATDASVSAAPSPAGTSQSVASKSDGSLGIGSLKGDVCHE
jgi:putative iron-dependent peroxidase